MENILKHFCECCCGTGSMCCAANPFGLLNGG